MACANDPGVDQRRQDGKCHVCKRWRSCGFCNLCCHWICRECNPRLFARAMEAIKVKLGKPKTNCCGPKVPRKECAA